MFVHIFWNKIRKPSVAASEVFIHYSKLYAIGSNTNEKADFDSFWKEP